MIAAAQTTATVDGAVYHTERHASVNLFITTDMVDHDKEKRREQNLIVRSRKSEAELALDIVLMKLQTDTNHRAASLRQQSYLSLALHNYNGV